MPANAGKSVLKKLIVNKNNPPDPKGHGGKFLFRGGLANNLLCIVF